MKTYLTLILLIILVHRQVVQVLKITLIKVTNIVDVRSGAGTNLKVGAFFGRAPPTFWL